MAAGIRAEAGVGTSLADNRSKRYRLDSTQGPLARDARVRFCTDVSRIYAFDFLVLKELNARASRTAQLYGLIALRDMVNNFAGIKVDGEFVLNPDGKPINLPNLILIRR